jgi:drug/metabolite transporter (DMT)-like permease
MSAQTYPKRLKATQMLVLATVFWGLSFPVMKAVGMAQQLLLPHASSWFTTSSSISLRFGVASLIMVIWIWPTIHRTTRLEFLQGLGLGIFGGIGILFQMDGLAYTSASTSAFLTLCYCLFLPVIVGIRDRQWPSALIVGCCLMVMAGVAILADVDWRTMRLGRGEWETLLGSLIFTAQILWLERPLFAQNKVTHFTLVMFLVTTLTSLPVLLFTAHSPSDLLIAYGSPAVLGLTAILVILTLIAYVLMNYWQRHVSATEAGLIYGAEPVFASLFALFLPAWFSALAGLNYPNEKVTFNLLVGGGLISAANVLIQIKAARPMQPQP